MNEFIRPADGSDKRDPSTSTDNKTTRPYLGDDLDQNIDQSIDQSIDQGFDRDIDMGAETRNTMREFASNQAQSEYPDDYLTTDFDFEIQSCRAAIERLSNLKAEARERTEHQCSDLTLEIRRLQKKLEATRESGAFEASRLERAISAERAKHDVLLSRH